VENNKAHAKKNHFSANLVAVLKLRHLPKRHLEFDPGIARRSANKLTGRYSTSLKRGAARPAQTKWTSPLSA
jgi:hypothetical protein